MNEIIYRDEGKINDIIGRIKKDGEGNVYVLADFDRTLTYSLVEGEKKPSLISVIRNNPKYLGNEYVTKANELFDHYHPIEIDVDISLEEKAKQMTNWWREHLNLLIESGLNKKHIDEVVNSGIIKIRSGIIDFLKFLDKNNIPLIILSANGLGGDSILDYLKFNKLYTSNIKIVSNKFEFDSQGNAIGYNQNVVHPFNKGEVVFSDFPEVKEIIKNRKNIILLGDSLGDIHMADGAVYENLLNIGFYNESNERKLNHFLEKYDVLLTGDSHGDFVNRIF